MSKRNLFIFITIIIILALAMWGLFAFLKSKSGERGGEESFFGRINPFPQRPNPTPTPETPELPREEIPIDMTAVRLRQVSSMPVAGFTVFEKERYKEIPRTLEVSQTPTPPETEFYPSVRYVARSNGNIYQTFADQISERRFSSTLVPKVYEAYFGDGGNSVIMRYLKSDERTIVTFLGTLPKESLGADIATENEIKGTFLPEGISDLAVSGNGNSLFYILPVGEGVAGITSTISGDKKNQVFDSAFSEWLPQWSKISTVMLTTKPSHQTPGYLYTLNTERKELTKTLGDINGLTTLTSPDGKFVLYADSNLYLYLYDVSLGKSDLLTARTLPEKCTWGKNSNVVYCSVPKFVPVSAFPDEWYKGKISFSDEIWKIDATTKNTEKISELFSGAKMEDMDNIKLSLDQNEGYLFFVNKKDSLLWQLILK